MHIIQYYLSNIFIQKCYMFLNNYQWLCQNDMCQKRCNSWHEKLSFLSAKLYVMIWRNYKHLNDFLHDIRVKLKIMPKLIHKYHI